MLKRTNVLLNAIIVILCLTRALRGYAQSDLAYFWGHLGVAICVTANAVSPLVKERDGLRKGVMVVFIASLIIAIRYLLLT